MQNKDKKIIFFGTPDYAIYTLDALFSNGYIPSLIVTAPDRKTGRHFKITPPPAKIWADEHNIPTLQPEKFTEEILEEIKSQNADFFIVSAYGKILPKKLLDLSPNGTLNVHPSLLPLYRGPAPEKGPVLSGDEKTGVTIILIDEEVDHGPILIQEEYIMTGNETTPELGKILFTRGGELLSEIIPKYLDNEIVLKEQDHIKATFTKKVKKEDGLITEEELKSAEIDTKTARNLWNKFRAYTPWPSLFFFHDNKRIKTTSAVFENEQFIIQKVIPEGKKEMDYKNFLENFE